MINRIVVDSDGVLADFNEGQYRVRNVPNPYLDISNHGKNLEEIWGMNKSEFFAPCDQNFWETLDKMPFADKLVDKIMELAGKKDIEVAVLTRVSNNDGCLEGKRNWFKKNFPQLSKSLILTNTSKGLCASPTSLLLDDYMKNIRQFDKYGGRSILIPGPANHLHGFYFAGLTLNYTIDKLLKEIINEA